LQRVPRNLPRSAIRADGGAPIVVARDSIHRAVGIGRAPSPEPATRLRRRRLAADARRRRLR
jgi:hypothetical protein